MAGSITKEKTIISEKEGKSQTLGYAVYFIFGIVEVFLAFRLVFKLLGANPGSGFVDFVYTVTQIFIAPYFGIFRQATTTGVETTAVLEPATIVAIVVYAVLAWGIAQMVLIFSDKSN